MTEYVQKKKVTNMPRIPLKGSIDLTYRCNNNCRHCWLRIPANSQKREDELTFDEICEIVDEARKMGCRRWSISGGEPMLRPDFVDIFDYITSKSASYSINTNGTLITPKIAKRLKRKGSKMVAIYGATAEVHDHITRIPGSFEATMQGFAYLKEAGTGFTVQFTPMRDNFHQYKEMVKLAESLSSSWRIGASWLYLSANDNPERNREIIRQRLDPKDMLEIDRPDISYERMNEEMGQIGNHLQEDDHLFKSCIENRRDFHIDPYGQMTFCYFIKDPSLRFDLRNGTLTEAWENFIPSLTYKIKGGQEYMENCGSCELISDCMYCPAYAYLEHRRFSAKVEYLCNIAKKKRRVLNSLKQKNRRYFKIARLTLQVESALPLHDSLFPEKFKVFEVPIPGDDKIIIRHYFALPDLEEHSIGKEIYRKGPWAIYRNRDKWIYIGINPEAEKHQIHRVVVFNHDHSHAIIYNKNEETVKKFGFATLTLFPTDLIIISRVLAYRKGCCLHSSGVVLDGNGILFAGHSGVGKSTIIKMLKGQAEILCDDRMIIRQWPEGFKIHGTWSHGEIPDVSPNEAPLKSIFFINKSDENRLERIKSQGYIVKKILECLIKPFITTDWWEKTLSLAENIAREVPCYNLYFDKSGKIIKSLKVICSNSELFSSK